LFPPKKLREHPIFQEYEVVLAAGDGKLDDDEETMKSYDQGIEKFINGRFMVKLTIGNRKKLIQIKRIFFRFSVNLYALLQLILDNF